MRFENLGFILM